jgi:ribosomal protein S18 acetylase RimI-like enzyme
MSEQAPENLTVTMRSPTEDDKENMHAIYNRAYHDVIVDQFGEWDASVQDDFFEHAWQQPGFAVVLVNDEVCGFVSTEQNDTQIFLLQLVIDPNYQGRGIGTQILEMIQQRAADTNVSIRLDVFFANTEAIQLYERQGFTITGQDNEHYHMLWRSGASS